MAQKKDEGLNGNEKIEQAASYSRSPRRSSWRIP